MVWPPPAQKTDWVDADVQLAQHPGAHNDIALTLANDYQPQVAANKTLSETNASEIVRVETELSTEIGDVDAAWQANETARNEDFVRGTNPVVVGGTVYLRGTGVQLQSTGAATATGKVPSVWTGFDDLGSTTSLSTSYKTLAQVSYAAAPFGNTRLVCHFTIDADCITSGGTVVAGITTVSSGEPTQQVIWRPSTATERTPMSGVFTSINAGSGTYYLRAKVNGGGSFQAGGTHTHMVVTAYYGAE